MIISGLPGLPVGSQTGLPRFSRDTQMPSRRVGRIGPIPEDPDEGLSVETALSTIGKTPLHQRVFLKLVEFDQPEKNAHDDELLASHQRMGDYTRDAERRGVSEMGVALTRLCMYLPSDRSSSQMGTKVDFLALFPQQQQTLVRGVLDELEEAGVLIHAVAGTIQQGFCTHTVYDRTRIGLSGWAYSKVIPELKTESV